MPGPTNGAGSLGLGIIARFGLGGRHIADGFEQPAGVEPVDPFEGGEFDSLEAPPWSAPVAHLGLEQAVDRLSQRVVVRVADAADRGLDARLGEPLGVAKQGYRIRGEANWASIRARN